MSRTEKLFKLGFVALVLALLIWLLFGGGEPSPSSSKSVQTLGVKGPTELAGTRIIVPPQSSITPEGAKPQAPPVSLPRATLGEKHIDAAGLRLIGGFEGFESCPYWDPYGHVWTRGYGETEGVGPNSPCLSRSEGLTRLQSLVESRYEWALRALGVALNQHQWDALCSFVWNLGAGIFEGTTVGADLRARAFFAASRQMLAYDHAGGVVLAGLRTRREAEVRLFLEPESKPKPPSYAQLKAELYRDYRQRAKLRTLLTDHRCRTGHAKPTRYQRTCSIWLKQGAATNRAIRALHARGIY
jgi:lysozyme